MKVSLVRKMFKEVNDFKKDSEYMRLFDEQYQKGEERKFFNNIKEYQMVDKAIAWAKANRSLALIGVIVVLGVLSNLLGFT
jgi:hypothetical protein